MEKNDPNQMFPVTYQVSLGNAIKPALIAIPLVILAIFGRGHLNSASPLWLWICALAAIALIGLGALGTGFCKLTLYPDRIEKKSLFGLKTMRRDDIGKVVTSKNGLVMLTYRYNRGDGMMLPKNIGGGLAWDTWMNTSVKI